MTILALDIGTTHCKAGLFSVDGKTIKIASKPMITRQSPQGWSYFDPDEVWDTLTTVVKETLGISTEPVAAIGIASMAETGILVDRRSGAARSHFIPWFDTAARPQAERVQSSTDSLENYRKFGLRINFKCGLSKLLWILENDPEALEGSIWLSAADYAAYRLAGTFATDPSLACRSLAFRVDQREWDSVWLREWGLPEDIFPPVHRSGAPAGSTASGGILPAGIPVAVSGHDHVCGALAAGAIQPGMVFDSMGTAEALIGALPERLLNETDFNTGLLYGCHVAPGCGYWMGGMSASGGSVEWLRNLLGDKPLSYTELDALLEQAPKDPTGILYYPYLLGSGSPHTGPRMRAGFIGLSASHGRADLLKAVLEGVAYEIEFVRRAGEQMIGQPISSLLTAGGGTRNRPWLQIKADVTGCSIQASAEPESTLLGAALAAGIGVGLYANTDQALEAISPRPMEVFSPDPRRHAIYQTFYQNGYLRLQEPLRQYFSDLAS